MSEVATYALYVDWNSDGDYGDSGEDISADWMKISITRGFNGPLARYPSVGRMTVQLRNAAQTYSPPATAAARPRRPVRLTMTYDGTTVTLFEGYIDTLKPASGTKRSRRAVMECIDDVAKLDQFEGSIALGTNVWADDVITSVVASVYTPASTSYAAGINIFAVAADRWTGQVAPGRGEHSGGVIQDVAAGDKIQDVCIADWGRFFIAGDGVPTFYNRHRTPLYGAADLTLDDTMVALDYQMSASDIYNYIEVTCHPRSIGNAYEVLGNNSQSAATIIEAAGSVTFNIRYRDPANNAIRLGGMSVLTPVANLDFFATDDEAGEGTDESGDITPTLTAYGDQAEIELANGAAYPIFIQSLRVRGYAVRTTEPITVVSQDATSITAYGKRKMSVDAVLMSSEVYAQTFAAYLLDYYKDPLHDVKGVTFFANTNATLMAAARDLDLLDKITLTESQTGLSAEDLFIYALRHTIERGRVHRVTVDLEQAYDIGGDPFIIASSEIGGAHVIVY